jgi:hypothetical protein
VTHGVLVDVECGGGPGRLRGPDGYDRPIWLAFYIAAITLCCVGILTSKRWLRAPLVIVGAACSVGFIVALSVGV